MSGHIIHIGYPKTGSMFLRRWFRKHPQLAYREGGIAGLHNIYQVCKEGASSQGEPLYRVTSCEGLALPHASFGDPIFDYDLDRERPINEAQTEVCRILRQLFPNAKIVIVTRGFRSLILSIHSQVARSGGRFHLRELGALMAQEVRKESNHPFDYDHLIQTYTNGFGAENVLVLPWELLRDDRTAFFAQLESRFGLAKIDTENDRVNPSLSDAELHWYPVGSRLVHSFASRLGRRGSRIVLGLWVRATMKNGLRIPIRLLHRLGATPGRRQDDLDPALLEACRGKAELLRGNPLYDPYRADYLQD